MSVAPAPKYLVIDDFLSERVLTALDAEVRADIPAMQLMALGDEPGKAYSALRRLWLRIGGLGAIEEAFERATLGQFQKLCSGTGIAPFDIARIETEVVAQRPGSFFAKHVDTDTREVSQTQATVRMISSVFYFPCEPLAFSGGELVLYDFAGQAPTAKIKPRRNRMIAFPSFAFHEVTMLEGRDDSFDAARWSVNCWLHRARQIEA